MSKIYVGQKIPLKSFITDANGVVDLSNADVTFNYYIPFNQSDIPDGNVEGSVVDLVTGEVSGEITANINTSHGEWRIQEIVNDGGEDWPAHTLDYTVHRLGK